MSDYPKRPISVKRINQPKSSTDSYEAIDLLVSAQDTVNLVMYELRDAKEEMRIAKEVAIKSLVKNGDYHLLNINMHAVRRAKNNREVY